jgi:hypothetical protein
MIYVTILKTHAGGFWALKKYNIQFNIIFSLSVIRQIRRGQKREKVYQHVREVAFMVIFQT